MKDSIAIQIQSHESPERTQKTINSIKNHLTDNLCLIIDKLAWWDFYNTEFNCQKICGFEHGFPINSYRNQILGLLTLSSMYPNKKWYGHMEWDVEVRGSQLLKDLELCNDCWTAGFDQKEYDSNWNLLSQITERNITKTRYYLGCCVFFSGEFIEECNNKNYFNKILQASKMCPFYWPDYFDHSCDEAILPSLAYSYNKPGHFFKHEKYAVRYRPEWTVSDDISSYELIHPVKWT